MNDLLIAGARRWGDAAPTDLAIRAGRIVALGAEARAQPAAATLDARGQLALPGFVDGHAHLDKTFWGEPWQPHRAGPTIADRIDNERRQLRELKLSPARQSARLLRHMVARGTTHARTHVDIGPDVGLAHLHGVMATRETHRAVIDLQIVAFPQTGVMRQPGTLDLLDAAVCEGADAIGGIDPFAIDGDAAGQLDGIFAIAARRGCELDIHLHERGEQGARSIGMICDRAQALGLAGKVALGHAFCLGELPPSVLEPLLGRLAALDIAVMTHAPMGYLPFPPVRRLAEAGVRLFTGSDGVRDAWTPLNTGDLLERAYLIAYNSGFRDDAGLELALSMATFGGARVMRLRDYGLDAGCRADLVLVDAECAAEAVAAHPPRRLVLRHGRIVARDGAALLPQED
ncbi:MAG: cytosine deaminase [Burkholderiaceae bacterium]|nr:MAG: cytosine deaminase [Burkholderiaceae bacterium]